MLDKFQAIFEKLLNPYLPLEYIVYFAVILGVIVFLTFQASLLQNSVNKALEDKRDISDIKRTRSKLAFGLSVISIWSIVINIAFFSDFLELPLIFPIGIILFLALINIVYGIKHGYSILGLSSSFKVIAVWAVGIALIALPILYTLDSRPVIPASVVTNDSIMHSILATGIEATEDRQLVDYYQIGYPRGYHSVVYYVSDLLNVETYYLLFPVLIFFYSFIVFTFVDFLPSKGKSLKENLVLLIPTTPYLILVSMYGLYAAQIAVLPVLIAATLQTLKVRLIPEARFKNLLLFLIYLAVINIYGVYGFSLIVVAIGFRLVTLVLPYVDLGGVRGKVNLNIKVRELQSYVLIPLLKLPYEIFIKTKIGIVTLILAIPSAILFFNNLRISLETSDLTFSQGNAFFHPLHMTGTWPDNVFFRDSLNNLNVYILLILFGLQILIIARAKRLTTLIKGLLLMLFVFLMFTLVIQTPYAAFKYFTYVIPVFMFTFGLYLYMELDRIQNKFEIKDNLKRLIVITIFLGYLLITLGFSIRSFDNLNPKGADYFEQFEYLNEKYITQGDTLIFAGDSWSQYFITEEGDYAPSYGWYLRAYDNRNPDFIAIEYEAVKVNEEIGNKYHEFLSKHPAIASSIETTPEECKDYKQDFLIINLNCE